MLRLDLSCLVLVVFFEAFPFCIFFVILKQVPIKLLVIFLISSISKETETSTALLQMS